MVMILCLIHLGGIYWHIGQTTYGDVSATAIGPAGYTPGFSGDCSGGMMSIETKKCVITDRPG